VAQENHHLTTEQLSAHLDGQLSDLEQSQLEAHLKTCEWCQQALTDLRRTVALLHALPRPALPRSFVLPLDIQPSNVEQREDVVDEADRVPLALAAARARRSEASGGELSRRRWPGYVRTALRTVSAIAAVIGFVFFLSGALVALPHAGGASNSAASSSGTVNMPEVKSNASPGAKLATSDNKEVTPSSEATIIPQTVTAAPEATTTSGQTALTPTAAHQAVQTYSAAPPTSQMPTILFFDLSSGPGRLGFGFLLLLLGVMGFVVFKRRRQLERA